MASCLSPVIPSLQRSVPVWSVICYRNPVHTGLILEREFCVQLPGWTELIPAFRRTRYQRLLPESGGAVANGKNNKKRRWIVTAIVSVAVVALVIVAVAATRGGTKIDPTKLAKVERGDITKSVVATGKVTPITKVEIKSKASGIVKKLYVDTNDRVKQGQALAELDKIEIEAQGNSAQAQRESSQADSKST